MPQQDGSVRQFAYEDVGAFLRFITAEAKITEQAHLPGVIEKLFSVVDPVNVGAAKRASELASDVGERLLLMHMSGSDEKPKARQIAENLNKSFFAHADAVSRSRARDLQLKIAKEDKHLEKLMWAAYEGLEQYMELRTPFIPMQHFLAEPSAAASVAPIASIQIPPNIPANVTQQIWQNAMNQAVQQMANNPQGVRVPYRLVNAVVESNLVASEHVTVGWLSGARNVNGEIQLSGVDTLARWTRVDPIPPTPSTGSGPVGP
jgi:hypothetical protein